MRGCWDKARQPNVAGVLTIQVTRIEADGQFHVGGYDNRAHADVFGDAFFGEEATASANAMDSCVETWLATQRYPGVTRLETTYHLLPP